jgi:hypothetical protein
MSMILLQARQVHFYGDGIVRVVVESAPLTEEQEKVAVQLFPNLYPEFDRLLDKERLLASLCRHTTIPGKVHKVVDALHPAKDNK